MLVKRIVTNTLSWPSVAINGDNPWNIQVLRARFHQRTAHGSLGLGESYIDRDWDIASLDGLFRHIHVAGFENGQISRLNCA